MESTPKRKPTPTIADVAKKSGVGVGTVSRVLNDSPLVKERTRRHVRDVIDELGYRPNSLARQLRTGRSMTVCVIAPFFTRPAMVERLRGFVRPLTIDGYEVVLYDVETPEQRDEQLRRLEANSAADGALLLLPPNEVEALRLAERGISAILIAATHPSLPHIVVDDVRGGYLATRHLLDLGHHRIAFVGDLVDQHFGFTSSRDRRTGYLEALKEANADLDPILITEAPHGRSTAETRAEELMRLPEPPTAIFATSDTQALGVLDAAHHAGLEVPRDLSVIGFDDIEVSAYVGLTTVRQPLRESGELGAELLLRMLVGEPVVPLERQLPLELVVRRTTAAP
ncbi:MAG: LacI family DNA-binding transcriptional regulator [Gaiellaceae bacterium]